MLIVGVFNNTLFSPMDRSSRQNLNRNTGANRHYNPNEYNMFTENSTQTQNNKHSPRHIMELSPKLITNSKKKIPNR